MKIKTEALFLVSYACQKNQMDAKGNFIKLKHKTRVVHTALKK